MVVQGLQKYGIGKCSNFCIGVLQNASNEPNEAHSSQTVSPYLRGTISAGYKDASHAFAMLAPHACAADDSPTFPGRKKTQCVSVVRKSLVWTRHKVSQSCAAAAKPLQMRQAK